MASNYKSTTSQLIAIYRLDFYKNKKNWKLYEDIKKEHSQATKNTSKLNKTYSVGEEFPEVEYDEQVSQHNKAFFDEEPEDLPEPQPLDAKLSMSAEDIAPPASAPLILAPPIPAPTIPVPLIPAPLIPAPPITAPPILPAPDQDLYQPLSWSDQPWDIDKPDQPWDVDRPETPWPDDQQAWCGAKAEGMPEQLAVYDQCDGPFHQHNLWTPASHFELNPAVDPLDTQEEQSTPSQMLHAAGEWLQQRGWQQEECPSFDECEDQSADFIRGAHVAPHSSEIDLSVSQECPCLCRDSLCALSVCQLALAVRAHHTALALLLHEQARRERLTSRTLYTPIPFEDHPTRDTDPLRPPDWILSGSHRAVSGLLPAPDTGRGRGRLQTHRLIGIGMGRPYRL